eukprot:6328236-Amphidinium_carterae.1
MSVSKQPARSGDPCEIKVRLTALRVPPGPSAATLTQAVSSGLVALRCAQHTCTHNRSELGGRAMVQEHHQDACPS